MVVGRGCTGGLLQGACGARVLINPNLLHASSVNPGNLRNVVWGPPALEFHPLTSNPTSRKNTNQTLLPIGLWAPRGSRSGVVGGPVHCAANSRGPVEPEAHRGREAAPVDEAATQQQQQQQQSYDEKAKKKRRRNRKGERTVYLLAAVASSIGFTALAAAAVYYRFVWQMQGGMEIPYVEMLGTFSLAIGAAVGMEFWARWAHKALWHASLWNMHESHHKPREGPFELNDVFAIINAVPAIALMAFGFFNKGFIPGLTFGAGLGITMFGMAYMFVHDGLVHKRFPVGPIADVPYLQKVAAAHQLHHADLFGGVPYGLFLGPKELEDVGGEEELSKVLSSRNKAREGDRQRVKCVK